MTSNHHAPDGLGYTRTTMADTESSEPARGANLRKSVSSDRKLKPDSVKPESLVIADQHAAVIGRSSRRGTHRPSNHGSRQCPKPVANSQGREPSKAGLTTGVKS